MTRQQTQSLDDLEHASQPLRLRDLMRLTGWSRPTLMAEMDAGRLKGFRRYGFPGYPWQFHPQDVTAWWRLVSGRVD